MVSKASGFGLFWSDPADQLVLGRIISTAVLQCARDAGAPVMRTAAATLFVPHNRTQTLTYLQH